MTPPPNPLHFALQRTFEEVFEPDSVSDAPLVRFSAYASHHRIFGWVRLRAERLTDLLNTHDELLLSDVEIENLADGTRHSSETIQVATRQLVAVHAAGPRGDEALRRRTRAHPVAIWTGCYLVAGHLHAEPGIEPLESMRHRPAMVPLTDAWLEYWSDGTPRRHGVGTIIVNREVADAIELVTDDDLIDGLLQPRPAPKSEPAASA
jgi:hypothetical protein